MAVDPTRQMALEFQEPFAFFGFWGGYKEFVINTVALAWLGNDFSVTKSSKRQGDGDSVSKLQRDCM